MSKCICRISATNDRVLVLGCAVHDRFRIPATQAPESIKRINEDLNDFIQCSQCSRMERGVGDAVPIGWDSFFCEGAWRAHCPDCVAADVRVEAFMATAMPRTNMIMLSFAKGAFELHAAEARRIVDVLSGAIAILDGGHPVQARGAGA